MDFLDPKKQKQHTIRLAFGYAIMGAVLILTTTVLLYQAYGFGIDKEGRVIQNGVVFVSSKPNGAKIAVHGSGRQFTDTSNAKMIIPAGQYAMQLTKDGYREWRRALTVEGGRVGRFDYAMLFPTKLATTPVQAYSAAPSTVSQSMDNRWLLVAPAEQNVLDLYDLNAAKPAAKQLTVPADVLSVGTTTKTWQAVEWAKDNRHVVLKRDFDKSGQAGSEYVLFDRQDPTLSQNLSVLFGFTPTTIQLHNHAYDKYFLFDQNSGELFTASLKQPTPAEYLSNVLAFKSDADMVLYVTAQGAPAGTATVKEKRNNERPFTVRQVPTSSAYLLDLATYSDDAYVAVGSQVENKVYVYKNVESAIERAPADPLVPVDILKVAAPNYVAFSENKRFIMAENTDHFAVYDAEVDRDYAYTVKVAPDQPVGHAVWMDGFRLTYVSGTKVVVFDYDGNNFQSLFASNPSLMTAFDPKYRYMYTIDTANVLDATALLAPADL